MLNLSTNILYVNNLKSLTLVLLFSTIDSNNLSKLRAKREIVSSVNKSVQYDDTGTIGVRASSADGELYAFVNIPTGKRVDIALTYVYGIGRTRAKNICEKIGLDPSIKISDLSEDQLELISKFTSAQSTLCINDTSVVKFKKNNLINRAYGSTISNSFKTFDISIPFTLA